MLPNRSNDSKMPPVIKSIHVIYASTSGNTEYAVEVVRERFRHKAKTIKFSVTKAEQADAKDLHKGDLLILASGTWNTYGIEGQMNPHMHDLLDAHAAGVDLKNKKVAFIALGDDRYYYTCRSGEHMRTFVRTHNGTPYGDPLLVINDPYGQEDRINKWVDKLLLTMKKS